MGHLFPIFLDLTNKKCVIIGGGKVAERKVNNLLAYGAKITIVSPEIEHGIKEKVDIGLLTWHKRQFKDKDIKQAYMVYSATNDPVINKRVADLCLAAGILVNAVDDPPNCNFYVPSIVRRNSLVVAISTEGKSPLLAKKLREEFEQIITAEHGEFVDILGNLREIIKKEVKDIEERKKLFESLVNSDILELLQKGEKEKVRERVEQCISSLQD
ncbi:Precorrin-2 oxidase [Candidatus Syntrophocurvum alkaliphilum]|uniref:precorrin-2 dehydrogenase n=1 Tax=Candidatus Syntrophocurvum alkaliphilum TaxID=2293317 RepID=A0A6I6DHF0_9FIRM|nr:bifunctional precorrin-2 dehydrogenase/sirohydrochlorin ferrochelatase [Candidatus Syntrophocurvum alkaliphilum]QGT99049.1 Precorrin-2 oxidase [Candidatus Syntrophocurvum alkaliphilum]